MAESRSNLERIIDILAKYADGQISNDHLQAVFRENSDFYALLERLVGSSLTTPLGDEIVVGDITNSSLIAIGHGALAVGIFPRSGLQASAGTPAPIAPFVGREDELAEIIRAIQPTDATPALVAIQGMAGVGKSQLAYAAAHKLKAQFPDGQIYLVCPDARFVNVVEMFQQAIHALAPDADLPDQVDELGTRYRSLLQDKRVLIIVDNANDLAYARHLRPPAGCALMITSRQRFDLPGLHTISLNPFTPEAAERFLRKRSDRIGTSVSKLARRCGYLPLALEISAAFLNTYPSKDVDEYCIELEQQRLATLQDLDYPDNPGASVEASLRLSYQHLPSHAQVALNALSLFVGDFDAPAAVAVIGEGTAGRRSLDVLERHSLVVYDKDRKRYLLHDLVRDFAQARLTSILPVQNRYLAHYLAISERADRLRQEADEAWLTPLDTERSNIDLALSYALQLEDVEAAYRFGAYLWRYWIQGGARERMRLEQIAHLELSEEQSELRSLRAELLSGAGSLAYRHANYPLACMYHQHSLDIRRELGNQEAIARSLNNLGTTYCASGQEEDLVKAEPLFAECLAISQAISFESGIVNATVQLGVIARDLGHFDQAILHFSRSSQLAESLNDKASAADNLAIAYYYAGQMQAAHRYYLEAKRLFEEANTEWGVSSVVEGIAWIALRTGNVQQAARGFQDCLRNSLADRLDDLELRALALEGLCEVAFLENRSTWAAELLGAAFALREEGLPLRILDRPSAEKREANLQQLLGTERFSQVISTAAGQVDQVLQQALTDPRWSSE